jgi:hypothetical protein
MWNLDHMCGLAGWDHGAMLYSGALSNTPSSRCSFQRLADEYVNRELLPIYKGSTQNKKQRSKQNKRFNTDVRQKETDQRARREGRGVGRRPRRKLQR